MMVKDIGFTMILCISSMYINSQEVALQRSAVVCPVPVMIRVWILQLDPAGYCLASIGQGFNLRAEIFNRDTVSCSRLYPQSSSTVV